jgi:tetratricopeptide (TPR) repeat protein
MLFQLGRYNEAINWFNKSINENPGFLEALNNKGIALLYDGKYKESTDFFNAVINGHGHLDEDLIVTARIGKGLGLLFMGQKLQALDNFNNATRNNSKESWKAGFDKGVTLQLLNRNAEAEIAFKEARQLRIAQFGNSSMSNKVKGMLQHLNTIYFALYRNYG